MAEVDSTTSYFYHGAVLLTACIISLYLLFKVTGGFPPYPQSRVTSFLEECRSVPVAHKGGSGPENTLAAIRRAKGHQCRVVEVDLEFTMDGHPVLLHDHSVDRTSNGTGRIGEMTLEEVRRLDFGSWFDPEFSGERIPTLQEAVELCRELDLSIILDVKSNRRKTIAVLQQLFQDTNLYDRIVVSSFNPDLIYMVRRADPNIMVSLAMRSWEFTWDQSGRRKQHPEWWKYMFAPLYDVARTFVNEHISWRLVKQPFVLMHKGDISRDVVGKWKARGVHVLAWTMESGEEAERYRTEFDIPVLVDYTD